MSFAKRFIDGENLPTLLSEFDVQQSFCLSPDDVAAVAERFRHDRRVAAAIQKLFLRARGRPMDRFASVAKTLLRAVCEVLQTPQSTDSGRPRSAIRRTAPRNTSGACCERCFCATTSPSRTIGARSTRCSTGGSRCTNCCAPCMAARWPLSVAAGGKRWRPYQARTRCRPTSCWPGTRVAWKAWWRSSSVTAPESRRTGCAGSGAHFSHINFRGTFRFNVERYTDVLVERAASRAAARLTGEACMSAMRWSADLHF